MGLIGGLVGGAICGSVAGPLGTVVGGLMGLGLGHWKPGTVTCPHCGTELKPDDPNARRIQCCECRRYFNIDK